MRYTQFTAALPTRTTLRNTATRGRLAHATLALVAAAAFLAGTTLIAFAVGVLLASLPGHPLALLAAAAFTTFAVYALPLLALRAATRAALATE